MDAALPAHPTPQPHCPPGTSVSGGWERGGCGGETGSPMPPPRDPPAFKAEFRLLAEMSRLRASLGAELCLSSSPSASVSPERALLLGRPSQGLISFPAGDFAECTHSPLHSRPPSHLRQMETRLALRQEMRRRRPCKEAPSVTAALLPGGQELGWQDFGSHFPITIPHLEHKWLVVG